MDHSFAMDNHAAERYVLGELNEPERDAYEDHFFSCPVCADEIQSATEFIETARHVVQTELKAAIYGQAARRSVWGSWLKNWRIMLQPFPAVACLFLFAVSGFTMYQNTVTIPQLARNAGSAEPQTQMAQLAMEKPFVLSEARGGPGDTLSVPRNKAVPLQFDIFDKNYDSYLAEITTASGVRKLQLAIPKKDAADPVLMLAPAGALESGHYEVVVQGISGHGENSKKGEVAHFSFELNVQD